MLMSLEVSFAFVCKHHDKRDNVPMSVTNRSLKQARVADALLLLFDLINFLLNLSFVACFDAMLENEEMLS